MFARGQNINRRYYGKDIPNFMELPNLIDIQIQSYNKFLNDDNDRKDKDGANAEGLESVFRSTFPIESITRICLYNIFLIRWIMKASNFPK